MLITHLSDSHIATPASEGDNRLEELGRCVEHINGLDPQPDIVVHTGDVTHNATQTEYAESRALLDRLRAPLYAIPGNRDERRAFRAAFADRLPENAHSEFLQYAVMGERYGAIMLDSVIAGHKKGRLCETRLAHFDAMLGDAGDRQVFVFMHHPPFEVTESSFPFQFEDWSDVDALAAIVSRHPNVRHIYCGHSHRTAKGRIADIETSTIPSVAVDLRMGPPAEMQEVLPVYRLGEE